MMTDQCCAEIEHVCWFGPIGEGTFYNGVHENSADGLAYGSGTFQQSRLASFTIRRFMPRVGPFVKPRDNGESFVTNPIAATPTIPQLEKHRAGELSSKASSFKYRVPGCCSYSYTF